jgi:hypothetical protein
LCYFHVGRIYESITEKQQQYFTKQGTREQD